MVCVIPFSAAVNGLVYMNCFVSFIHSVTDVWVAGTQLMAGRHLLTIDERKLKHDIKEWAYNVRTSERTEEEDNYASNEDGKK